MSNFRLSGLLGAGFRGNSGFAGSRGVSGFTGSQGVSGFTGSQGVSGFTGSRGVSGFTGSQGAIGFTGSTVTNIPPSTNTTIVSSDRGKYLNVSTNVTINSSTGFSSGDAVSIYNNSTVERTITATGVTLRLAGTNETGNRTMDQRALVTILCVGVNDYVISGAGLS